MLLVATLFFALAALLGMYLLSFILQNKNTPKGIAFIHGPLAAIGLLILIVYALIYRPAPIISIILFVMAALGGFVMIYRDITGKSLPKWMALGHGMIALIGFVFLIVFMYMK